MIDGNPTDLLGMSDEDFLNLNDPGAAASGDDGLSGEQTPNPPVETADVAITGTEASEAAPTVPDEGEVEGSAETPQSTETPSPDPVPASDEAVPEVAGDPAPKAEGADVPQEQTPVEEPGKTTDYKAFYEQIMKPFKANGKMIELRDPSEAITLMQMGANYTRRMQELAPHRKMLMMLQNNDLLDPDKLSFLIDLDRGDPEAVKKFVKDRGIDPLDIDTSTDPAYLGGTHHVSDEEAAFKSALEELRSTPAGQETLREVAGQWDTASKDLLWKNPEIFHVITEQRESGVYAVIVDEIDRQRTLGTLRADMPFLEAYKTVGDQLVAAAGQAKPGLSNTTTEPVPAAPQVLGTSVATPKSPVQNSNEAAAASPSRGTATKAKSFVNPLAMPDDEFLRQMENRV